MHQRSARAGDVARHESALLARCRASSRLPAERESDYPAHVDYRGETAPEVLVIHGSERTIDACRLHRVIDVVFHEDLSRLGSGQGPRNMAIVRHVALDRVRGAKGKHNLEVCRNSAAWNHTYIEASI